MAASIRFEQDSENFDPVSTDEGVLDEVVTLSNFSNTGVNAWRWVLLDKPEGSSATISTPTANTAEFTPDIEGTYLVQLRTYADTAALTIEGTDTQAFGVRYEGTFSWRIPAAGEGLQYGARGWAKELNRILVSIRDFFVNGGGGLPPTGPNGSVLTVVDDEPAWAEGNGSAASHIVSIASAQLGSPIPITGTSTNTTFTTTDVESDVVPCVRLTIEDMVDGYYFRVNPGVALPNRFTVALGFSAAGAVSGPPIVGVGLVEASGAPDATHFLTFAYAGGAKSVGFQAVYGSITEYYHQSTPTLATEFYLELDIETKNITAVETSPLVEMAAAFYGNANIVGTEPYTVDVDRNAVVQAETVLQSTESARTVMRTASHPDPWDASWDTLNMKHVMFSIFTPDDPLTAVFDIRDFRILKHPKDR